MLTACGAEPVTYAADAVAVLESPEHGPQLCAAVATSLPPQCEGPDVVGWDWSVVRHESVRGTKWGWYRVVGTWDGSRLTLTEPPGAAVEGVADEELQRCLDDKYGEGVVRLEAVLKPAG